MKTKRSFSIKEIEAFFLQYMESYVYENIFTDIWQVIGFQFLVDTDSSVCRHELMSFTLPAEKIHNKFS